CRGWEDRSRRQRDRLPNFSIFSLRDGGAERAGRGDNGIDCGFWILRQRFRVQMGGWDGAVRWDSAVVGDGDCRGRWQDADNRELPSCINLYRDQLLMASAVNSNQH